MPRQPKPWFWTKRGAWYIQIEGKQVKLHENKKEADREFYRIMASEGKLDQKQSTRMTIADACEALIAQSQRLRPKRDDSTSASTDCSPLLQWATDY